MSVMLALYDEIVRAQRAADDEVTIKLFHPEFVVYEDPGMS